MKKAAQSMAGQQR